jgi:hypothetical protein
MFIVFDCFTGSSDAMFDHVETVRLAKQLTAYDIAAIVLQVPYRQSFKVARYDGANKDKL